MRIALVSRYVALVLIATLLAPAAQACQLICVKTMAAYNGNLGGLSGADAKCAAEYPGFKFARSFSLVNNIPGNPALNSIFSSTWIGGENNMTCNNWTDGTTSYRGPYTQINAQSSTGSLMYVYNYTSSAVYCDSMRYLACCNM